MKGWGRHTHTEKYGKIYRERETHTHTSTKTFMDRKTH